MKKNTLKRLATLTAILFSFLFAGCAQMSSSGTMGEPMDTMMEENTDTMKAPEMNRSMETMDEPMMQEPMNTMDESMGETMDEMKTGTAKDDMMGEKEEKMGSETDKMMK